MTLEKPMLLILKLIGNKRWKTTDVLNAYIDDAKIHAPITREAFIRNLNQLVPMGLIASGNNIIGLCEDEEVWLTKKGLAVLAEGRSA